MFCIMIRAIFRPLFCLLPLEMKVRFWIFRKAGISLSILNWIIQRVFRLDNKYRYPKHFTSRILYPELLEIEDDDSTVLASLAVSGGCYIHAGRGITIGKGTIIAPNAVIVSLGHDVKDYSIAPQDPPISVGRFCWIGASAVIRPGVVLGDHTIVGAGSVVTKSFKEGRVVLGGVPAQVIKVLEKESL